MSYFNKYFFFLKNDLCHVQFLVHKGNRKIVLKYFYKIIYKDNYVKYS